MITLKLSKVLFYCFAMAAVTQVSSAFAAAPVVNCGPDKVRFAPNYKDVDGDGYYVKASGLVFCVTPREDYVIKRGASHGVNGVRYTAATTKLDCNDASPEFKATKKVNAKADMKKNIYVKIAETSKCLKEGDISFSYLDWKNPKVDKVVVKRGEVLAPQIAAAPVSEKGANIVIEDCTRVMVTSLGESAYCHPMNVPNDVYCKVTVSEATCEQVAELTAAATGKEQTYIPGRGSVYNYASDCSNISGTFKSEKHNFVGGSESPLHIGSVDGETIYQMSAKFVPAYGANTAPFNRPDAGTACGIESTQLSVNEEEYCQPERVTTKKFYDNVRFWVVQAKSPPGGMTKDNWQHFYDDAHEWCRTKRNEYVKYNFSCTHNATRYFLNSEVEAGRKSCDEEVERMYMSAYGNFPADPNNSNAVNSTDPNFSQNQAASAAAANAAAANAAQQSLACQTQKYDTWIESQGCICRPGRSYISVTGTASCQNFAPGPDGETSSERTDRLRNFCHSIGFNDFLELSGPEGECSN